MPHCPVWSSPKKCLPQSVFLSSYHGYFLTKHIWLHLSFFNDSSSFLTSCPIVKLFGLGTVPFMMWPQHTAPVPFPSPSHHSPKLQPTMTSHVSFQNSVSCTFCSHGLKCPFFLCLLCIANPHPVFKTLQSLFISPSEAILGTPFIWLFLCLPLPLDGIP